MSDKRLKMLALVSVLLAALIVSIAPAGKSEIHIIGSEAKLTENIDTVIPSEYIRRTDQTYLTFPEWYLVFSPQEYADHLKHASPSSFPFLGHVGQFWSSYGTILKSLDGYPFHVGYHLMISVIGMSTTVEYTLMACYERSIGRLTEFLAGSDTEEDQLAAKAAQDYVAFIKDVPWYEFDFASRLKQTWTTQIGGNAIRSWERKYWLTAQYGAKMLYGGLIKVMTKGVYGDAENYTAVTLDRPVKDSITSLPLKDRRTLLLAPRYDKFVGFARSVALQGANFTTIAGNRGKLLVSILLPEERKMAHVLFRQKIMTRPGLERVVLALSVSELAGYLRQMPQNVDLEHIFDY